MPLYDYRCDNCSHEEEILHDRNDEKLMECPKCKEVAFHRQVSAPAFSFKGGGWYKDLYASPGSKSGGEASSTTKTTSSADTSSSTKSSDSKAKADA